MSDVSEDSPKGKTVKYQLEILKQEIEHVEQIIARIDDVTQTIKNWTVVVWSGSIAIILGRTELRMFIGFTAIVPFLFWLTDAGWRMQQAYLFLRSKQISEFLNDQRLYQSIKQGKLVDFIIYDPMARKNRDNPEYKKQLSYWNAIWASIGRNFYLGLIIMSIAVGVFFWLYPMP
jgi:hypothetical protein